MPGLGHKSYIQIGKESVYGTGVAATSKLEVISMNVAPVVGVIQDPSLSNAQSRRGLYQGPIMYRGTFLVRLNYDGLLELFRGVTGTYSNAIVEGSVRDHTFKEGATLNSYSIECIEGDVTAGTDFRLVGAKIIVVTIRGTAGNGTDAMLQAEFTVLAKDKVAGHTPTGALTFPGVYPVLYHQGITMDDGTADAASSVRVRGLEFTLENPHTEDRFYMGSVNMDEPLRTDFLTARFRLTQEFTTLTQFNAAKAFTIGSPDFKFQHPTTIGSTSKREFQVSATNANLVEFSAPVEGYGIIISTAVWEAFYTTGDASAVVMRFRSLDAALA